MHEDALLSAPSAAVQLHAVDTLSDDQGVVAVLERLARIEALLDRLQREQVPNYRMAWPALQREHAEIMKRHGLRFELDEQGDYWLALKGQPILFVRHRGLAAAGEQRDEYRCEEDVRESSVAGSSLFRDPAVSSAHD